MRDRRQRLWQSGSQEIYKCLRGLATFHQRLCYYKCKIHISAPDSCNCSIVIRIWLTLAALLRNFSLCDVFAGKVKDSVLCRSWLLLKSSFPLFNFLGEIVSRGFHCKENQPLSCFFWSKTNVVSKEISYAGSWSTNGVTLGSLSSFLRTKETLQNVICCKRCIKWAYF